MTCYDETLHTLQEKVARFRQLSAILQELREQKKGLNFRVRKLQTIKLDEEADVEQLEGRSLKSFFLNVIGKMDEKLDKERQEAYAARVKYDAAARELAAVEDEIEQCEAEYLSLRDSEQQYNKALSEKAAAIKAAGGENIDELLRLEERYTFLTSHTKELREAISAGNSAHSTASSVLNSLSSAEGWGTYDLMGGGLLADAAKHSHLDEAQSSIETLQSQLRRFKTELADVTIHSDLQVGVDSFMRFADYFFDGLFADWAVLDEISRSKGEVQSTISQIEHTLARLNAMSDAATQEQTKVKETLDQLILDAKLES